MNINNINFIFKKPKFLTLLFLLIIFELIYRKLILFLAKLNHFFSLTLCYFKSFITYIDILFKPFQN